MVLPGTWSAALILILVSIVCFGLWPYLFKMAGSKWRFELFSFDFAAGALLLTFLAAFTLGTLGSDLSFSDAMLVAGRRAELIAVVAGAVFALAAMLYFGSMALLGLPKATLLLFSVFGCGVSLSHLQHGRYLTSTLAFLVLALAAAFAVAAIRSRQPAPVAALAATVGSGNAAKARLPQSSASARHSAGYSRSSSRGKQAQPPAPIPASTKGIITGILGGLVLAAVPPVIGYAQPEQLGIGAYGGMLLAALGMFGATFLLSFFFLNVSLQGGVVRYSAYLSGTSRNHLVGLLCGVCWALGALALYAALTGTATVNAAVGWASPFAGALLALLLARFLQPQKASASPVATKFPLGLALFVCGAAVLLVGFRK